MSARLVENQDGDGGRIVRVEGRLFDPETGCDYATAEAVFVRLSPDVLEVFRVKLAKPGGAG